MALPSKAQFFGREISLLYGADETDVSTDRAPLQSPPAKLDRLQARPGNPDRCEDMALPAPHDDVAADEIAATTSDDRCHNVRRNNNNEGEPATAARQGHPRRVTPVWVEVSRLRRVR